MDLGIFHRSSILVCSDSDHTPDLTSRHCNTRSLSPFRSEGRYVLKLVAGHGCAILIAVVVATAAYPLCGLIVGYVSAITAIQVLGERGGEIMVEPGPYVLLSFLFMTLMLAGAGVGYPVYRFTLKKLRKFAVFAD